VEENMPIGPKIPQRLKTRICQLFLDMRANDAKTNAHMIGEAIRDEEHRRDPELPDGWPSDSAVRKILAPLRNPEANKSVDDDDRPWSLAALAFCDIPPDAVPEITKNWAMRIIYRTNHPLTIRQAKWIAKLRHFDFAIRGGDLYMAANHYASDEFLRTALGKEYPSTRDEACLEWSQDLNVLAHTDIDPDDFFRAFDNIHANTPPNVRERQRQEFEIQFGLREDPEDGR